MKNLLNNLKEKVSDRKTSKKMLDLEEKKLDKHLNHLENLEEARAIFQKASQITQTQLSEQISGIVSSALAAVFDEPYTFKVDFVQRRNVTECELYFEKNNKKYFPLRSCGFGAASVASLALRIGYWKLDGGARSCLILDEPLVALSLNKHERASMMIRELSRMEGGLQFIIVTHSVALSTYADKVFQVSKTNNISTAIEIEKTIKEDQNDYSRRTFKSS